MRPLMRPLKPISTLFTLALALPLAACGDNTDPGTTGAVETDPPVVVEPADPVAPTDPLAPPAGDTTLQ